MKATSSAIYARSHAHHSKHVVLENVGRAELAVYQVDRYTGELVEWTKIAPTERIALQPVAGTLFQLSLVDHD